ncbi:phosphatase PAP2 family protein [Psychromonas sp. MB-3u-54]|uniref:phosphatase PAP2 family protein n=1 Tax=Psychromonas sp. MB-3u-54 TaxID=2058319 RepID=UPI001E2BF6FF|nr:phosphatase PAP2 family protein [Psychromonas sp. MB-3u-54]
MTLFNNIYQYDLKLLMWCRKSSTSHHFISLVRITSKSGDGYLQLLLPAIYWLMATQFYNHFLILIMLTFMLERLLYFILKHTLCRRRPPQVIPDFKSIIQASDQFSFPSGHSMAAFTLAGLFTFHFGVIALPLYIWATAVAISRVILGVHFPTDILAGAFIGTILVYIMVAL